MPRTKISEFSANPSLNTDIDGINIAEGCPPSGINDAIRELMAQLKDQQTGASGDSFSVGGTLSVTGSATFASTLALTGALSANGGVSATTIAASGNATVGGTLGVTGALTANGGASTTNLSYTGTLTGGTGVVNLGSGQFVKDASGNVGVGVTPNYRLHVSGATSTDANADLTGAQFVANGIAFRQRGNSAGISGATYAKQIYASGSPDVMEIYNASNYALVFGTNAAERARINSNGDFLCGTTSAVGGAKLSVYAGGNGIGLQTTSTSDCIFVLANTGGTTGQSVYVMPFRFGSTQTLKGAIYYNGGTGLMEYQGTSDYRVKQDIVDAPGQLEKIKAVKVREFLMTGASQRVTGFLAHELQEQFPAAVLGEKDAVDENGDPVLQSVNQQALIPMLVKAIQEQQALIETLTQRIAALEGSSEGSAA